LESSAGNYAAIKYTRRSKRFIWKFFFEVPRWITCFSIRRVEVPIWQSRNHKIIGLHDVFVGDSLLCLVMDLMVSDLSRAIESASHPLPRNRIKCYFRMILEAVSFCHSKHIIHRDIKPASTVIYYFLFQSITTSVLYFSSYL